MQPGVGGAGARGGCLSTTPCVGRGDQAGLAAGRACRLSGSPVFCVRLPVEPSRLRGCLGLPLGQPVCQAPELCSSRDGVTDVGSILQCWVRGSQAHAHAPAAGC